jgi:rRNA-processing protein FCF1
MIKIVIDTNFVTIPFQFKVDVYSEIGRIINESYVLEFPKICLAELQKIKQGKAALELMERKGVNFVNIPFKKNVDDSIIDYAKEKKATIATQDSLLKKKALKNSLSVITLRKKQYLIKSGGI